MTRGSSEIVTLHGLFSIPQAVEVELDHLDVGKVAVALERRPRWFLQEVLESGVPLGGGAPGPGNRS